MKRKIMKIFLILIIVLILIKILQIHKLIIMNNNIEKFENLNNSEYNVQIFKNRNKIMYINRKVKDSKYLEFNELISKNIIKFWKQIDTENKEGIIVHYNLNKKQFYEYESENYRGLRNLPEITRTIEFIYKNIKSGKILSVFNCFKILYIIPTNYNGIDCYKIRTTKELLYIERQTLYPIHLEYYEKNSSDNMQKVEIEYIFKTDCVTDEEMEIPDLENYTWIEESHLDEQVDKDL